MQKQGKLYTIFTLIFFLFIFESALLKIPSTVESVWITGAQTGTSIGSDTTTLPSDGSPSTKRIALTFDDGPHPEYTAKLLDGLRERNIRATFFVIGENAGRYPELLKRMSEEGHCIGNHTYSHVQLSCVTTETALEEIARTNRIIKEATGRDVLYLRPPYGSLSKELSSRIGLTPVLWTIDPRDWSVLNTDSVAKHILARADDGDIILLHDIFETSVDAAFIVIDALQEEGFMFVTVEEMLQ